MRAAARLLGSPLLLAGVLLSPHAGAQEGRWLDLTWRAPPECPSGAEIEREITRLVGTARRDRGMLRATVEVTGNDERGWRAHVASDYGGEAGERALEGATCRAVARAAALVIALTIDSNAGRGEEPPPPPPPREPDVAPRPVLRPEARPRELRWLVGAGPGSETGLLHSPGFGVEVAFGLRIPEGSLELVGAGYLPQSVTIPETDAGGRLRLLTVELRACPNIVRGAVELFACASGGFARLSADGFGVNAPGADATWLGVVSAGPGIGFFLSPAHRLAIAGDVGYAPGHARFVLKDVGHVYTASHLTGTARIELAWYL